MLAQLLVQPFGTPGVRPLLMAVAAAGLVSPRLLEAPLTWIAITILLTLRLVAEWPMPDNHVYLKTYFCAAVAIALMLPRSDRALARSSRLLIGLAFAFAVLWKAGLSSDFVDGRFFRVTLLSDRRFDDVIQLIGGLGEAEVRENRQYLMALPEGDEPSKTMQLHEPAGVRGLAFAATWGAVLLEGTVALTFLWPGVRLRPVRHAALLTFAVLTYTLAPVPGFGWLLLAMGLCDTHPGEGRLRAAYLVVFVAVLFSAETQWGALLR
jgi:hypothetical protein